MSLLFNSAKSFWHQMHTILPWCIGFTVPFLVLFYFNYSLPLLAYLFYCVMIPLLEILTYRYIFHITPITFAQAIKSGFYGFIVNNFFYISFYFLCTYSSDAFQKSLKIFEQLDPRIYIYTFGLVFLIVLFIFLLNLLYALFMVFPFIIILIAINHVLKHKLSLVQVLIYEGQQHFFKRSKSLMQTVKRDHLISRWVMNGFMSVVLFILYLAGKNEFGVVYLFFSLLFIFTFPIKILSNGVLYRKALNIPSSCESLNGKQKRL